MSGPRPVSPPVPANTDLDDSPGLALGRAIRALDEAHGRIAATPDMFGVHPMHSPLLRSVRRVRGALNRVYRQITPSAEQAAIAALLSREILARECGA